MTRVFSLLTKVGAKANFPGFPGPLPDSFCEPTQEGRAHATS